MHPNDTTDEIPYGYCHCGCGQKTNLAPSTNSSRGWIKGQPVRLVNGHSVHKTLKERFWGMVDPSSAPDSCWEWKGYVAKNGYGHMTPHLAHRVSWEVHNGPIPDGLQVCHKCDNRKCVNPAHLFLGTQSENLHDMVGKGRRHYPGFLGETNHRSILTEDAVRSIREKFQNGTRQIDIAREFNVDRTVVWSIVHRKSWKHI